VSAPPRQLVPTQRRSQPGGDPAGGALGSGESEKKPAILSPSTLFAIVGILLGSVEQYIFNLPDFARALWTIALIGAGFPVVWRTLRAARQGNYATDLVASLSIVTAAIIGQPLAGLVIVLMQTGGESLERFAERRASAAVRELEKAAPRIAHLVTGDRGLIEPGWAEPDRSRLGRRAGLPRGQR